MDIKDLQKKVLELAKEKGWDTNPDKTIFAEHIALIHEEVSETLDAYRKGQLDKDGPIAEELGDVIMRTLHLAGIYDLDLEKAIDKKLEKNKGRDWSEDTLIKNKK